MRRTSLEQFGLERDRERSRRRIGLTQEIVSPVDRIRRNLIDLARSVHDPAQKLDLTIYARRGNTAFLANAVFRVGFRCLSFALASAARDRLGKLAGDLGEQGIFTEKAQYIFGHVLGIDGAGLPLRDLIEIQSRGVVEGHLRALSIEITGRGFDSDRVFDPLRRALFPDAGRAEKATTFDREIIVP